MKNIQQYFTTRTVLFIAIFTIVGFIALQIPVTKLAGSAAKFTVFNAFAPITGAFIGSVPGVIAVMLMQLTNFLVHGAQVQDIGTIIRFFPMLFAVLYFARRSKLNLIIPIVIAERFLFAFGVAASYIFVNNLLYALEQKGVLRLGFRVDSKYLFPWKLA